MNYTYKTHGTCSSEINFEINDGIISNVVFKGGCNGNLKAIGRLVDGKNAEEVAEILKGNTCGYKKTSCADQLAQAILSAMNSK